MNYLDTYTKCFSTSYYSSGEGSKDPKNKYIIDCINNDNINTIIDISSGRGSLIKLIKESFSDIKILSTDLQKFHEEDVDFIKLDLSLAEDRDKLIDNKKSDLLTCMDVLEHLDKSFIDDVLHMISSISKTVILTIANHSDILDGVELHTIQEDYSYWGPLLSKYFDTVYYEEKYFWNKNGKPRLYLLKLKPKCS